jgi:DNA recombination protein RmuC
MNELLDIHPLVALGAGAAAGALIAWCLCAARGRAVIDLAVEQARNDAATRARVAEAALDVERERREIAEAAASRATDRITALSHDLAVAEERAEHLATRGDEREQFLVAARSQLEQTFDSLAASALEASNRRFLELADRRLATAREGARADLDGKRQEIETLVGPLRETLGRLEQRTADVERARVDAYARLDKQVAALATVAGDLGERTTSLVTALRGTRTRGRWGELALRNVVEIAGMSEHCDFEEQATTTDGRRPDVTVRLPGGRLIAVDAKAPLDAYLDACDAATDAARGAALDRHVTALRAHVRELASRGYAAALPGDVDLVVLFLPGESFLGAAFAHAPELQAEALRSRVLIATPATLIALLRTVAIYWQQRDIARNAESIAEAARELYERSAYDRAVGSFERRFVPMARRLEELHATDHAKRRIEPPPVVDGARAESI